MHQYLCKMSNATKTKKKLAKCNGKKTVLDEEIIEMKKKKSLKNLKEKIKKNPTLISSIYS